MVAEGNVSAYRRGPQRAACGIPVLFGRSSSLWPILVLLVSLGLVGCSHAPQRTDEPHTGVPAAQDNQLAAEIAASLIGTPYQAGGDRPQEGFDCSGLVHYCYRVLGFDLPRNVSAQKAVTEPVATPALQIGDLLFFRIGGSIGHVGIYYGDGEFVHAPSSGKAVMRSRLDDPYWRTRLAGSGRPMPETQGSGGSSPRSSSEVLTSDGRSAAATGALSRKP